jgi:hypothetical protein
MIPPGAAVAAAQPMISRHAPGTSTSPSSVSWRELVLVLAASLLVTTLMTWPMVPRLGSVGRLDSGDGKVSIWNVGWVDHALLTDPRHLLDANIFWPHLGTLTYSEMNLVAGLLGLPTFILTHNALAAHNAAVLTALVLSLILTWQLVRGLTGSSGAGFVSGVLFTFCSYLWGHTAHVQLLMTFVVPLVMLVFHRLRDRPSIRSSILLGVALATAGLACGYYGVYGGILVGFASVVFARREAKYWLALGGAAVTAGLLVLPFVVPYARIRAATGAEPLRTEADQQISADLQDYLTSPTALENAIVPFKWADPPHESLSPGFVLGILVAIAFGTTGAFASGRLRETFPALIRKLFGRTSRTAESADRLTEWQVLWGYAAVTLLAVWASFGPAYGLYAVLMRVIPGMSFVRAPSRLGVDVALGLAVIGGFGARWLIAERRWALALLVAACVLDRYAGWPSAQADPIPRVYRVLATLPRGGVVDFPFPYQPNDFHHHTRSMYNSTVDWMPRVNGYSDIVPSDFLDIAVPINDFPELSAFPLMYRYHVRYVVWELAGYPRGTVVFNRLASRFGAAAQYLRPIVRDTDYWLYEIVGWPPGVAP